MRRDSREPWYWARKDTWYAWVNGRQLSLGVRGKDNKLAAAVALAGLVGPASVRPAPPAPGAPDVARLVAVFLADARARVRPETLAVWRSALGRLETAFGPRAADSLKPFEVEAWARRFGTSPSTVNTILTSVVTAVRWAVRSGLLTANPLAGLRKPPHVSRGAKAALTDEQFARLCEAAPPHFRTFLTGLWLTGCRPGELSALTAADVDFLAGVAALVEHKTAGKTGRPRLIFLSPAALELFRELVRPDGGHLFLNSWGNAWNRFALQKAMEAARTKAGVSGAILYGLRHSYATAALLRGVPDATVAALLGHAGTAMLHRHYSHITARAQAMRAAAAQVRCSRPAPVQGESHHGRAQS